MARSRLALLGAAPAFGTPLPVGQLYFPAWERYEAAFRGIFERQHYTNQGPLVQELEERLQAFLGVRHAICVGNATIALMMLPDALGLTGKVVLPSFTFVASAQSVTWAGLEPVFCDVDAETHHITPENLAEAMDDDVSAIMGVNLWGGACDLASISEFARARGVQLYFDSAHGFGSAVDGVRLGGFGRAEVFSFHATKILNATEGGCVCTNDDDLAARLRNIRSSRGAGKPVPVVKTAGGRMSEAQAAVALMSLEDFPENQKKNEGLFLQYEERLAMIPGLTLVKPAGVSFSNCQYLVCRVDEDAFGLSRNQLVEVLRAENVLARRYFYPGAHRSIPYAQAFPQYLDRLPNTDALCQTCIQFPIGALVSGQDAEVVCDILATAHELAGEVRSPRGK